MPVIPTDFGESSTPRGPISPQVNPGSFGAVGAGLQAIAETARAVVEQNRERIDASTAIEASARARVELIRRQQQLQQEIGPGADGYAERMMETFNEVQSEIMGGLTPGAAARLAPFWSDLGTRLYGDSLAWQHDRSVEHSFNQVNEAVTHLEGELALGGDYASARAQLEAYRDQYAQWAGPEAADAWFQEQLPRLAASSLEAMRPVAAGSLPPLSAASTSNYAANIRAAESGGDPRAQNPNSSASGLYQFTRGTWEGLGYDWADRFVPAKQEEAFLRLTARNGEYLQRNLGHVPADWEMYGAHFLGPGGYVEFAAAPDNARMTDIMSAEVIRANAFLADKTAGDIRAWLQRKMGTGTTWTNITDQPAAPTLVAEAGGDIPEAVAAALPDAYWDLSPEGRRRWLSQVEEEQTRQQQELEAADATRRSFVLYDLTNGVDHGQVGVAEIEDAILRGEITPEQGTTLRRKAEEVLGDETARVVGLTEAQAVYLGQAFMDPNNSDQVKYADELYRAMVAQRSSLSTDALLEFAVDFSDRMGVVVPTLESTIRAGLHGSAEQKVMAADLLDRLATRDPAALATMPEAQRELGMMISSYVRLGVQPAEAVRLAEADVYGTDDAVRERRRATLAEDSGKMATDFEEALAGEFEIGEGPAGEQFMATGRRLYERYFEETGSDEVAATLAKAALARAGWGESTINGEATVMMFAPEQLYGVNTAGLASQGSTWMREQLVGDLETAGLIPAAGISPQEAAAQGLPGALAGLAGVEPQDVDTRLERAGIIVASDPQTARDQTYALLQRQESGLLVPLLGPDDQPYRWAPSWPESPEFQRFGERQRENLEAARTGREEALRVQEQQTQGPFLTTPRDYSRPLIAVPGLQ